MIRKKSKYQSHQIFNIRYFKTSLLNHLCGWFSLLPKSNLTLESVLLIYNFWVLHRQCHDWHRVWHITLFLLSVSWNLSGFIYSHSVRSGPPIPVLVLSNGPSSTSPGVQFLHLVKLNKRAVVLDWFYGYPSVTSDTCHRRESKSS